MFFWIGEILDILFMLGNFLFFFLFEGLVIVVFEFFYIKLLKYFNRVLIEFVRLKENKLKGFER